MATFQAQSLQFRLICKSQTHRVNKDAFENEFKSAKHVEERKSAGCQASGVTCAQAETHSSLLLKEPVKSRVWANLLVECCEQERRQLFVSTYTHTHTHAHTHMNTDTHERMHNVDARSISAVKSILLMLINYIIFQINFFPTSV